MPIRYLNKLILSIESDPFESVIIQRTLRLCDGRHAPVGVKRIDAMFSLVSDFHLFPITLINSLYPIAKNTTSIRIRVGIDSI
jgi:hypothetical protein